MRLIFAVRFFCALYAVFWIVALISATSQPAYAYIDPGSGLLMLQMIGTTFAGMMFLLRKRLRQFLERVSGHFTKAKSGATER